MTAWTDYVKEFAKNKGVSYGCALSDPECSRTYKSKLLKSPKKEIFEPEITRIKKPKKIFEPEITRIKKPKKIFEPEITRISMPYPTKENQIIHNKLVNELENERQKLIEIIKKLGLQNDDNITPANMEIFKNSKKKYDKLSNAYNKFRMKYNFENIPAKK